MIMPDVLNQQLTSETGLLLTSGCLHNYSGSGAISRRRQSFLV